MKSIRLFSHRCALLNDLNQGIELSRRTHWVALIAMLLTFLCVPAILHNRVAHSAESGGYDVSADPGLFTLIEFAGAVCG